jgi:hypothetical protein
MHLFKFKIQFFSLLPPSLALSALLFTLHVDLVKMVQHVPILMEAMHVFVSMDGRATIAVKILTIVWMLPVLMVRLALMESGILRVVVHRARLDFFVIWMMLALPILAMPMPFVKQVRLMDRSRARVRKAIKDQIVLRILMNAFKVSLIQTILNKNN